MVMNAVGDHLPIEIARRALTKPVFALLAFFQICAVNGVCQTDFCAAQPKYTLDLHAHGYHDSDQAGPRFDGGELRVCVGFGSCRGRRPEKQVVGASPNESLRLRHESQYRSGCA
jgi:hypothetical protein